MDNDGNSKIKDRVRAFFISNLVAIGSSIPSILVENEGTWFQKKWWQPWIGSFSLDYLLNGFRLSFVVIVLDYLSTMKKNTKKKTNSNQLKQKQEEEKINNNNKISTLELLMRLLFVAIPMGKNFF